jgi:NAD(P)H-hydrate repair Nnr-like enzyme with NAD(P)H-hydrate dehydratase domain
MGSTIAQLQDLPILENVARAVFWHGLSADLTAQRQGQVAIRTTSFIEHFSEALRIST